MHNDQQLFNRKENTAMIFLEITSDDENEKAFEIQSKGYGA